MKLIPMIVVAALTFGICFLVDRSFKRIFRSRVEHVSGLSVRLNKRYATIGIILVVLGICALFAGFRGYRILIFGGIAVILMGVALIVYYMTFSIFYNEDSFLLNTFGRRGVSYRYNQIQGQLLYNAGGNILVELHMKDGRAVTLQSTMVGAFPFLDHAFENWCRQTGRSPESCDFHDPDHSLWFPMMEG